MLFMKICVIMMHLKIFFRLYFFSVSRLCFAHFCIVTKYDDKRKHE